MKQKFHQTEKDADIKDIKVTSKLSTKLHKNILTTVGHCIFNDSVKLAVVIVS